MSTKAAAARTPPAPIGPTKAAKGPLEAYIEHAKTGDFGPLISTIGMTKLEQRSAAAIKAVLELEKSDPATLKKLATTDGPFQSMLLFIATKPYVDADVGKGLTALMAARNGPVKKEAPTAAWGSKPRVQFSGRPSYSANDPMPEGLAQPLDSAAKRYGSEFKDGKIKTDGQFTKRTTNVICDYEVAVRNPKSGEVERVVFEGIQQARKVPWGMSSWYDTLDDIDSKVLACEGHRYGPKESKPNDKREGPMFIWVSGAIESTVAFSYETIPELKARVEHFKKTGETGNETGKKRGR